MKRIRINSLELDCIKAKNIYCYTFNNNKLVNWVKRKYHKRERRNGMKMVQEGLE